MTILSCKVQSKTPEGIATKFYEVVMQKGSEGINDALIYVDPSPSKQDDFRKMLLSLFEYAGNNFPIDTKFKAIVVKSSKAITSNGEDVFYVTAMQKKGSNNTKLEFRLKKIKGEWYIEQLPFDVLFENIPI